jgi:hypothetical protein
VRHTLTSHTNTRTIVSLGSGESPHHLRRSSTLTVAVHATDTRPDDLDRAACPDVAPELPEHLLDLLAQQRARHAEHPGDVEQHPLRPPALVHQLDAREWRARGGLGQCAQQAGRQGHLALPAMSDAADAPALHRGLRPLDGRGGEQGRRRRRPRDAAVEDLPAGLPADGAVQRPGAPHPAEHPEQQDGREDAEEEREDGLLQVHPGLRGRDGHPAGELLHPGRPLR